MTPVCQPPQKVCTGRASEGELAVTLLISDRASTAALAATLVATWSEMGEGLSTVGWPVTATAASSARPAGPGGRAGLRVTG